MSVRFEAVDPQGQDALALLREAAVAARELYPETRPADAPWPTNGPADEWLCYLVGYLEAEAVVCGALRRLDEDAAELKRMYVRESHRTRGLGRAVLERLLQEASRHGCRFVRLETGIRQPAAIALYESHGFRRIEPFGEHVGDPYALCYEIEVGPAVQGDGVAPE